MRPAHGLAAHRRLAALHTAALALGLTARRYSAETGGEGLVHWAWFHPANIATWYYKQIFFVSLPDQCTLPQKTTRQTDETDYDGGSACGHGDACARRARL